MKIAIISLGGITNFGERAILLGTIEYLWKTYHNPEICLLGYEHIREHDDFIGRYLIERNVRMLPQMIPSSSQFLKLFRVLGLYVFPRWFLTDDQYKAVKEADIVVSKGQESFTGTYGFVHFTDSFLEAFLASRINKQVILLGHSVGPLPTRLHKAITRYVLGKLAKVYARDPLSFDILKALRYENVERINDLAFLSVGLFDKKSPKREKRVLLVPNKALAQSGEDSDYFENLTHIARSFIKAGIPVDIASSVTATDWNNDYTLCASLKKVVPELNLLHFADLESLLWEIKSVGLVISSRLHPLILASALETPVAAISSAPKVLGILSESKVAHIILDPYHISNADMESMLAMVK